MKKELENRIPHKHGYPGDGWYYVLCDICGCKVRRKDATAMRRDPRYYGSSASLLVCKRDADEPNLSDYVRGVKERKVPVSTRGEPTDTFIDEVIT